ncbi:glycosyltransferase family 4 protein [Mariniflexile sp. AS56]|uniref:glycosyltransferase family 4 protein n=1 Tax=Mariniflexile sp. AS56 TaxID=3063957 RepID=UPI0026EA9A40|nr:glycosyltransferase family 4 protein [Mariniflexile sp. AS56]MDO7171358.1 glycosyltransferase family 4 protein [Mariniflexile sp. AS56]
MKILILLSRIDQTGVTTNTLDLVSGLIKESNDVYLVTGGPIECNNPRLDAIYDNFKKIGTKVNQFSIPKGNSVQRLNTSFLSILKIMYYILKIKPDVIHAQSPYMSFIPWLMHKKFVSTLHVNDFVKSFKYKNATHLIAISRETRDYAMDLFKYKNEDITIVNHGVSEAFAINMSLEEKNAFKLANNIPLDKVIIGFVGSIEKRKGHDLLLQAVESLDASIKDKIHIIFLGSSKHNNTRPWLDNLIQITNTKDSVTCFDYQDPKKFYDIFDIFVLPSRLEGFGLVVIEAMMNGCCVLRSNTEGAYDQINHGEDGFIFDNNNYQQLAELLKTSIENIPLRLTIAEKGKEKALNKFTIKAMTQGTLHVYNKII